jgi:hypothetical protein
MTDNARAHDLPPFLNLGEAYALATKQDADLTQADFLKQMRRHLATGKLTPTGFRNGNGERVEIPKITWADYRPVFQDFGCAIPERASEESWPSPFVDDDSVLVLAATLPMFDGKLASGRPAIAWMDLRFLTQEIAAIWPGHKPASTVSHIGIALNEQGARNVIQKAIDALAKSNPGRVLSQEAGVKAVKAADSNFNREKARDLTKDLTNNTKRGRPTTRR